MVVTKNHKYLQKVAISVQYGPDVMCVDKSSFAHCKLVVRNRFCGNKYYGRFCCRLDMIETYSFLTQSLLSNNPEKKKKKHLYVCGHMADGHTFVEQVLYITLFNFYF